MADGNARLRSRVRWAVGVFIVGLVVSGATAVPLETEVRARFPELSAAAVNRVVNGASYEWR